MVRRNSIEASTRSSMVESELIRGSESPYQADLKFLSGEYYRLVPKTSKLLAKFDSLEAKMDANFNELQQTLSQISNQFGIIPIDAETSSQTLPVPYSDPYVSDDHNRLPLDNRKSLLRKIELPKFDGSDAYDWLSKVERIFRVGRYSDSDKLDLVALSLERDVLKWFNWQLIRREFRSWEDFRRRFFRKFGAAPAESPDNRLFAIKQTGTVSASVTELEELSAQVIEQQTVYKEDSITQLQVPVSTLEHSLQIHIESPNVCENYQDVVGCDELGSEVNVFSGLSPTSQVNELCELQKDTVSAYVTESKELSSQVDGLDASHLEQIFDNGLPTEMKEVLKLKEPRVLENQNTDVLRMETSSFCQPFSAETLTSKPVGSVSSLSFAVGTAANWSSGLSQNRQVWEPGGVLADHVLEDNVEADSQGLAYDGCVLLGMNCAGLGSDKAELLATGQQMQRNNLTSSNGGAESFPFLHVATVQPLLWLQESSANYLIVSEITKEKQMLGYMTRLFKYKGRLKKINLTDTKFLWEKVHMVSCLSWDTQFHSLEFQLKHKWRSKHLHTMSALEFQQTHNGAHILGLTHPFKPGLESGVHQQVQSSAPVSLEEELLAVLGKHQQVQFSAPPEMLPAALWIPAAILEMKFDEFGCLEFLIQWQDRVASEITASKLEDKLVFEGGSIDTIKQSYYTKKKPRVETKGFSCKEALERNRGFAVSLLEVWEAEINRES